MAVAFGGGPCLSADQVRAESGISCVPGVDTISGGLRINDVERVASSHGVFIDYGRKPDGSYTSWSRDTLRQRLVAGHGAILLGDCQDAPVNPTAGVVLHSAFVHGLDANGRTHWHDPRLSTAYWITLEDVIRYWESFNGSVRYAGFVAPDQAGSPPDTSTPPGDDMGLKLTDGASYSGTIDIRAGAKFYPLVLDGGVGGTLPACTKRAFCTGYSPKLNKRLYVIEEEFAGVDVQDVTRENKEPWPPGGGTPPTSATKLAKGFYEVP